MGLIETTVEQISPQDQKYRERAKERLDQLTMPHWALGRLMDLAVDLAGITRSLAPPVGRKAIVTMAGDHGVVEEGVSKYPQEVTPQMVHNFVNGGAGINALARQAGARVVVVDMGVAADMSELVASGSIISKKIAPGTGNIARGPAMTREQAVAAIEAGISVANELADSVGKTARQIFPYDLRNVRCRADAGEIDSARGSTHAQEGPQVAAHEGAGDAQYHSYDPAAAVLARHQPFGQGAGDQSKYNPRYKSHNDNSE